VAIEAGPRRLGVDDEAAEERERREAVEEPDHALDASLRVEGDVHRVERSLHHPIGTRALSRPWIAGEDRARVNYFHVNRRSTR